MANYATGTGLTPIIVFRNHAGRTLEVLHTPASNFTDPDDAYDFVPNGSNDAQDYLNQQGTYIYSPIPLPIPSVLPDVNGFYSAIFQDSSVSAAAKVQLPLTQPLLLQYSDQPDLMNQYWQAMIASNLYTWLDTPTQQELVTLANSFHIPLTMPSSES